MSEDQYSRIIDAGAATGSPKSVTGKAGFAVVPDGYQVKDLEKYGDEPRRIAEQITIETESSFADYFNRFKSSASVIFADKENGQVVGVLDYHEETAAFGDHVVTYPLPLSREWKIWTGSDGKYQAQADFARFMEENRIDIRKPDGAEILEIAHRLEAKKKVEFVSGVRLQDGSTELTYNETTESAGKGKLHVPEMITLGIPVYDGSDPYEVQAFLRYRIKDGLFFKYDLHRSDALKDDAFKRIVDGVEVSTATTVWRGRR